MKIKKIVSVVAFFLTLVMNVYSADAPQEFVIKKEEPSKELSGMSKNALKERLGDFTRRAFKQTTSLGCTIGAVQQRLARLCVSVRDQIKSKKDVHASLEISSKLHGAIGTLLIENATLQNKLSAVVENLIENQGPFKSASRTSLRESVMVIERLHKNLAGRVQNVKKIHEEMQKDIDAAGHKMLAERLGKAVNNDVCLFKEVRTQFSTDGCLKKL